MSNNLPPDRPVATAQDGDYRNPLQCSSIYLLSDRNSDGGMQANMVFAKTNVENPRNLDVGPFNLPIGPNMQVGMTARIIYVIEEDGSRIGHIVFNTQEEDNPPLSL